MVLSAWDCGDDSKFQNNLEASSHHADFQQMLVCSTSARASKCKRSSSLRAIVKRLLISLLLLILQEDLPK